MLAVPANYAPASLLVQECWFKNCRFKNCWFKNSVTKVESHGGDLNDGRPHNGAGQCSPRRVLNLN